MDKSAELKFTYSSVLSKDGKPFIAVMFEQGDCYAEGSIPQCRISKSKGFTEEEIKVLEAYMRMKKKEVIDNAKEISGFMNMF